MPETGVPGLCDDVPFGTVKWEVVVKPAFPVTVKVVSVVTPRVLTPLTTKLSDLTFAVDAAPVILGTFKVPVTTTFCNVTVPVLPIPAAAILVKAIYMMFFFYLSH
jgi:hypothetical protein